MEGCQRLKLLNKTYTAVYISYDSSENIFDLLLFKKSYATMLGLSGKLFQSFFLCYLCLIMKLTIEKLDQLTAQDEIDLAKIWPQQQPADWQRWMNEQRMIFAARFNARLLGAVKVSVVETQAELSDLCVREVTRRRGVGLYLLEDLQAQLPAIKALSMQAESNDPVLAAFMQACGFTLHNGNWHKLQA